jgi:hypothetical protein
LQSAPLRAIAERKASDAKVCCLPSLVRFLVIAGVAAALAYGAMLSLVTFVTPEPREMTQTISPSRLNK